MTYHVIRLEEKQAVCVYGRAHLDLNNAGSREVDLPVSDFLPRLRCPLSVICCPEVAKELLNLNMTSPPPHPALTFTCFLITYLHFTRTPATTLDISQPPKIALTTTSKRRVALIKIQSKNVENTSEVPQL
jgi:hypothetical protein